MKLIFVISATLLSLAAIAQESKPMDFPASLTTPSSQELTTYLAGRSFRAKFADGTPIKSKYGTDGSLSANAPGYYDTGKWRTEDGSEAAPTLTINVSSDRLDRSNLWPAEAADLETAAALLGKAYVRWRYIYEEIGNSLQGTIAFKPLLSMIFTLDFAIRSHRSESFISVGAGET